MSAVDWAPVTGVHRAELPEGVVAPRRQVVYRRDEALVRLALALVVDDVEAENQDENDQGRHDDASSNGVLPDRAL